MNRQITHMSVLFSLLCLVSGAQAPRAGTLAARGVSPPPVVLIPSSEIAQSPSAVEFSKPGSGASAKPGRAPASQAPNLGLQAVPAGKLDITLTPARPAFFNRGYLRYEYPRSVYLTADTAYAEYSKQNVPGFFVYSVRLEKGKKYLLELTVTVEPKNGTLAHSIGGQQSQHTLGAGFQTISAVVEPEATGWVSGTLHQSNSNAPTSWRVYSVGVKEL